MTRPPEPASTRGRTQRELTLQLGVGQDTPQPRLDPYGVRRVDGEHRVSAVGEDLLVGDDDRSFQREKEAKGGAR